MCLKKWSGSESSWESIETSCLHSCKTKAEAGFLHTREISAAKRAWKHFVEARKTPDTHRVPCSIAFPYSQPSGPVLPWSLELLGSSWCLLDFGQGAGPKQFSRDSSIHLVRLFSTSLGMKLARRGLRHSTGLVLTLTVFSIMMLVSRCHALMMAAVIFSGKPPPPLMLPTKLVFLPPSPSLCTLLPSSHRPNPLAR
jgi:hypothetical protein